ncbi:hypothetical protein DSM106972_037810 [Dulcicalothrix desertica PCC 7102]|uniref:Uncharacterized protein n=1 Tax=Dulcicalothrix desertica PCC 7102 TaxID=232991 RepID=A0A433VFU7_9CYAN|nr:hypothetical protein DSM106972_037810 [Dulcicalothrix desertica PCC 7102]
MKNNTVDKNISAEILEKLVQKRAHDVYLLLSKYIYREFLKNVKLEYTSWMFRKIKAKIAY